MNILISTNSNYFMATIVMLESLFENNNQEKITVYMLYSNLPENEINSIYELIENKFQGKLILLQVDKKLFKDAPIISRFSEEVYYRLLAQDILPSSIDRVLYLDVDIIVNKSLSKFYNQNFDGNYLVVCEGIGMSKIDKSTYENLNIPFDEKYFNSGVILYNLEMLRQNFNIKTFFNYISKKRDVLTMPDQDVLNALFYDKVKYNDYKLYNYGVIHIKSKNDLRFLKENTAIIHYIGNRKPWNYKYTLYGDDLFWKYANNTIYKREYINYMIKNKLFRIYSYIVDLIKSPLRKLKSILSKR